jgi:hypothetical protein
MVRLDAGQNMTLEEIERGFRDAALRDGNREFTKVLSKMSVAAPVCPECGQKMESLGIRSKRLVSLLGEGEISRQYYGCTNKACAKHALPKDIALGIANTSFSPGVRRAVAKLASYDSFEGSSAMLYELCGVFVCGKDVQRIAESIGAAIEARNNAKILDAFDSNSPKLQPAAAPIMYIE